MSLYFFSRIQLDARPMGEAALSATHPKLSLGAITSSSGKVIIFGGDGDQVGIVSRNQSCGALAWHPTEATLIVGWKNGEVTVWREGQDMVHRTVRDGAVVTAVAWFANICVAAVTKDSTHAVVAMQLEERALSQLWESAVEAPTSGLTPFLDSSEELAVAVYGPQSNTVWFIDDNQSVVALIALESGTTPSAVLWDSNKRRVVVLSNDYTLSVYTFDPSNHKVTQQVKSKISVGVNADSSVVKLLWASPGVVAISCGDEQVRFFNIDQEAMHFLTFPEDKFEKSDIAGRATSPPRGENIVGLTASSTKNLIAAATRTGRFVVWTFTGAAGASSESSDDWQVMTMMQAEERSPVEAAMFTSIGSIVAVHTDAASILQETPRLRKWCGSASVVQVAPDTVVVQTPQGQVPIKNHTRIKALDMMLPHIALFNGKQLEIYSINDNASGKTQVHAVEQASPVIGIHSEGIVVARQDKIVLLAFQLNVIQQISFAETEGLPALIDVMGDFVAAVSDKAMLKLCRIGARDMKVIGPTRILLKDVAPGHVPCAVKVNITGKKVAFLIRQEHGVNPLPLVYVYDLDTDHTSSYDFSEANRLPTDIVWNLPEGRGAGQNVNETESLLLAVETRYVGKPAKEKGEGDEHDVSVAVNPSNALEAADNENPATAEKVVSTFFACAAGVKHHSTLVLKQDCMCLVGCTIPNIILAYNKGDGQYNMAPQRLRDFEGMGAETDVKLRDALVQFAYCTTIGNMDEAYKVVKTVKDTNVWSNLARMCVTTGRLDVAEVCLANMNDAVAARALREAKKEPEKDARLATLAMSLNMLEEAEKILVRCKRHDMLTELYASCGKWEAALKHAEQHDRIRVYPVLFRHAQNLEAIGDVDGALALYEQARCYASEGPRLLFVAGRLETVRDRVQAGTADKELTLWWAQYLESIGEAESALKCYTQAKDGFNVVRMLTCQQPPQIDRAVELISDNTMPSAKGAAYFVGRHYETEGNTTKALHYYDVAGAYKNGLRLAKEHDMAGEAVALALKCDDKHVALETAVYFEQQEHYDKSAQLYQKGGDCQRAIDVCIKGGLYDELHRISESLDAGSDPETYIAMAEHFIHSGHYDKAVQMLVFGKAFNEALQLCLDKNVELSASMAESMTLPRGGNEEDEEYRISLLKKIAKVAKAQESWHLACKKYTQAGEHVRAMKMLLRSGDTDKILFFANHSRNAEIYIIAGNYLQSLNWQQDAGIYKNIVAFYNKAKAHDSLAGFYDACAQLHIDEDRDYDKALSTLREAQKALDKGDAPRNKKDQLRMRVELVEKFVHARRLIKPGEVSQEMEDECADLLVRANPMHQDHAVLDSAVRIGDIYALLVEYHDKLGQTDKAYALIERMQEGKIELTYFLEAALVEKICNAVGRDVASLTAKPGVGVTRDVDEDVGDVIDEEVY